MVVGELARVIKLDRPSEADRSRFEGRDGLVVRRLNQPWVPNLGALWQLRFDDGEVAVFSESELGTIGSDGEAVPVDMDIVREIWGDAPRRMSLPFRRFGGGSGAALGVPALLVFCLAGTLLIWAGISESSIALGGAGALLILIGIGSAAALVS